MIVVVLMVMAHESLVSLSSPRVALDLFILGYAFARVRLWLLEHRLNRGDWDHVRGWPRLATDAIRLKALEEIRCYGRRLSHAERQFAERHKLLNLPTHERWLLFATKAIYVRRKRVVVGSRLDLLFLTATGCWVLVATWSTVAAHFEVHGALATERLPWLPVELGPVMAFAYFFDLYLTRPYTLIRRLRLTTSSGEWPKNRKC